MRDNGSSTHFDVAVIGAGQAGLAVGYLLAQQDRRFVILDGADSIGASWRDRWDSLVLFTPRRYDSLPGLAFPGDPDGYPTRDEVVAYLEQYASTFELPVQLDSTRSLARPRMAGRSSSSSTATASRPTRSWSPPGRFRRRGCRASPSQLAPEVFQAHSADYRRPSDLPDGHGPGCRWRQHRLPDRNGALGHAPRPPRRSAHARRRYRRGSLGRDLFWWLETTRLLEHAGRLATRAEAERPRHADRLEPARASGATGSRMKPRATAASGRAVTLRGRDRAVSRRRDLGDRVRPRPRLDRPAVFDEAGESRTERGVTASPGLYFLGLPWQHTRGSALLGWVKDDARYLAQHISTSPAPITRSKELRQCRSPTSRRPLPHSVSDLHACHRRRARRALGR